MFPNMEGNYGRHCIIPGIVVRFSVVIVLLPSSLDIITNVQKSESRNQRNGPTRQASITPFSKDLLKSFSRCLY
jgi:hypothetical protein